MFRLISFQTICPPAHSASIREPDVNELPYFKEMSRSLLNLRTE